MISRTHCGHATDRESIKAVLETFDNDWNAESVEIHCCACRKTYSIYRSDFQVKDGE